MTVWLCATCGLEHPDTIEPPETCAICSDGRQYVPPTGQRWLTLAEVQQDRHAVVTKLEPNLHSIVVAPKVGIGHWSLLIQTDAGNVLWDPTGFYDDALLAAIGRLGGIVAIASSHPHLTGVSISLSHEFGRVPVWYGSDDRRWVRRPDEVVQFWSDHHELLPGTKLIQCGGHFAGSAVLHWADGAGGRGSILTGDTIRVNTDLKTVSFMRSYPNLIPLSPRSITKIANAVAPFQFDRIYGGFEGEIIKSGGHAAIQYSAERYIAWLSDEIRDPDERT